MGKEHLRFLGAHRSPRDILDRGIENLLLETARIQVEGLENIPLTGPFVIGYMPHSGWAGPFAIDRLIGRVRERPVWVTRAETRLQVPHLLLGDRQYIFITRENPESDVYQKALTALEHPQGIIASSFEGTRRGNPEDRNDLRTLSEAKTGLVRIATRARVPILPIIVLGEDKIIPSPEDIQAESGTMGVIKALFGAISKTEKPLLQVKILPLYSNHLSDEGEFSGGSIREHAQFHTERMVRGVAIPALLEMEQGYPLGFYAPSSNCELQ